METEGFYIDEKRWKKISWVLDFILSQPKTNLVEGGDAIISEPTIEQQAMATGGRSEAEQVDKPKRAILHSRQKAKPPAHKYSERSQQKKEKRSEEEVKYETEYVQLKLL